MLLNGGSRSALRPRSGNDENAVLGAAVAGGTAKSASHSSKGGGLGGGGGGAVNKPIVRLALGPAKSLDANGGGIGMNGSGVAKTPGPSNARRRAFGDISNRKAGRAGGNGAGAKTPKAVTFQSNLFGGPPTKTPGGGNGLGGKSANKKKGLQQQQQQQQQQRTPFGTSRQQQLQQGPNPNRSVSFEPVQVSSSSVKLPPSAVMPISSQKSSGISTNNNKSTSLSLVRDTVIAEDDDGSISSVELPAGGRIWDPSDFFDDDDDEPYDVAARVAAVNRSLDDPSFVMPTFPSAAAKDGAGSAGDRLLAKEMDELDKEDYETLDHLLNGLGVGEDDVDDDDDKGSDEDLLSGLTPPLDDDYANDDDDGFLLDDLALA